MRRQYSEEQEVALIDAVQSALLDAFRSPPGDRDLRLLTHAPHRFACPPSCAQPEAYTVISIDCFAGRSLDAKRSLYKNIVDNLAPLGIPPDHIKILLRKIPAQDWGVRGGEAACDVELGFKVDV